MTARVPLGICLVTALLVDPTPLAAGPPPTAAALPSSRMPGASPAIQVGEKLVFSVRYGILRAGQGSLEITGVEDVEGHPCYHVVSRARSSSTFDRIYRVRDIVQSWMDRDFLVSRRFARTLREGRFCADDFVACDPERRRATYPDGSVYEIPAGAHDILSAFYYVRTLRLSPGSEFWLDTHSFRKNYPVKVLVHRRERIEVPAGVFDCLVIEPMFRVPALFKHEGRLLIWLTDDERRMPVQMKSKVKIGSITAVLTSFERGDIAPVEEPPAGSGPSRGEASPGAWK
ncbi:MAG: DUF3108 domain-containing protein [Candidatus Eisenbacteria bacterium]|nr:DUF3108 domain-containing protein [Candidatus Eisenbacteria bacterium]